MRTAGIDGMLSAELVLQIAANKAVSIEYTLTNDAGEVIDSSAGGGPLVYLHGAGNIIPGLEQALDGKQVGDELKVSIEPENAYGEFSAELVAVLGRNMFEGVDELEEIVMLVAAQGYDVDRIVIDPSVVRGLGYYTGPVFEAELTFEILDEKGRKRQFGSVSGGGRYDDLVKRFTGQEVPATGVSIGVDRLLAALREKGRMGQVEKGPVVVTVMDRDRMADYQSMVGALRQAGIRAEVYLGNPKSFGNQMKYADRRNSPVAIIEGSDEKARGVVQIKDLVLGAEMAKSASLDEWKDRPSQYEVPREEMVAQVLAILKGQG